MTFQSLGLTVLRTSFIGGRQQTEDVGAGESDRNECHETTYNDKSSSSFDACLHRAKRLAARFKMQIVPHRQSLIASSVGAHIDNTQEELHKCKLGVHGSDDDADMRFPRGLTTPRISTTR